MHVCLARTNLSPSHAAVTTLIGLYNCLAKHCGKRPVLICLSASNHFLSADLTVLSRNLPNMCACILVRAHLHRYVACVCVCVCVCTVSCVYGSFKGSECGGLPFHRMSAVVQLRCTAWPYIWNTEKIHQWYLLPPSLDPSFIGLCASVYFGWTFVWVCNCDCAHG